MMAPRLSLIHIFPLSVRLMSIIVGMLSIGTIVITFSIRWLVSSYPMERVDQQLLEQADLVFPQMLNTDVNTQNGFTSYYVKVYNTNTGSSAVMLQPVLKDGDVYKRQPHGREYARHSRAVRRYCAGIASLGQAPCRVCARTGPNRHGTAPG